MTIVNIRVNAPGNGADVPAIGSLRWEPTARRVGPAGELILPTGFYVDLIDGQASVDVDPTTDMWVWAVIEVFAGQHARRRYLAVPTTGPVNYADLVPVDPVSLSPDLTLADGGGPGTVFDNATLLDGGTL